MSFGRRNKPGVATLDSSASPANESALPESWETLLYERFDAGWESNWGSWDNNPIEENDYWGDSHIKSYSAYHSAWCSGDGDMLDGGPHAGHCTAVLEYGHEIDLTDYVWPYLEYSIWADMCPGSYDSFYAHYALQPGAYVYWFQLDPTFMSSSTSGWELHSYYVPTDTFTLTSLFIRFCFESMEFPDGCRGVYLDDVKVKARKRFALSAQVVPDGWDASIVGSALPGTHTSDYVLMDDFYVDVAGYNAGPGTADSTYMVACLDRMYTQPLWVTLITDWPADSLVTFEDRLVHATRTGTHDLTVWLLSYDRDPTHGFEMSQSKDDDYYYVEHLILGPSTAVGYVRYHEWQSGDELKLPFCKVDVFTSSDTITPVGSGYTDMFGYYAIPYYCISGDTVQLRADLSHANDSVSVWLLDSINTQHPETRELVGWSQKYVSQSLTYTEITDGDGYPNANADVLLQAGCNAIRAYYQHSDFMKANWNSSFEFDAGQRFFVVTEDYWIDAWSHPDSTHHDVFIKRYYGACFPGDIDIRFIQHELAHVVWAEIQPQLLRGSGTHYWCSMSDRELAMSEGWANFVACFIPVQDQNAMWDGRCDDLQARRTIEENSKICFEPTTGDPFYGGEYWESCVSGFLYDLVDHDQEAYVDDDEFSIPFGDVFDVFATLAPPANNKLYASQFASAVATAGVVPTELRRQYCDLIDCFLLEKDIGGLSQYCDPNDVPDGDPSELLPKEFSVSCNYPNPFNPQTSLSISVPVVADLTVTVYNVLGQIVLSQKQVGVSPGVVQLDLNLSNQASGVYFARVQLGESTKTVKMLYLK